MPEMPVRCQFTHHWFAQHNANTAYGYADTPEGLPSQCWMTDTALFSAQAGVRWYCLLHAPDGLEPGNFGSPVPDPWRLSERGSQQAQRLEALVAEWNTANSTRPKSRRLALVLPGIRCGPIGLSLPEDPVVFSGDIILMDATLAGDVWFNGAHFLGEANFSRTRFGGKPLFDDAIFEIDAWFTATLFGSGASFSEAKFGAKAKFDAAKFQGPAWFDGAQFGDNAEFDNVRFDGTAWFETATFSKAARFNRTEFGEDAWYFRANFGRMALFFASKFGADVTFKECLFFGDAILHYETIAGMLQAQDCWFFDSLQLDYMRIERPAYLTQCRFRHMRYRNHTGERVFLNGCHNVDWTTDEIVLDSATGKQLTAGPRNRGAKSDPTRLGLLDFVDQRASLLTFQNTDLSRANLMGADLEGARFISCTWEGRPSVRYRKPYLDLVHESATENRDVNALRGVEALCRQVRTVLEKDKHFAQAGDFHYHEMDARRHLLRIAANAGGKLEWVQRLPLWIYRLTSDYGENYLKLSGWMVGSLVLTGTVISLVQAVGVGDDAAAFWNAFLGRLPEYGYKTFMGLMPFSTAKVVDLTSLKPLSKFLVAVEGLALISLTTLFVMALRRRFRR